jgi:hypothetical protein
MWMPTKISEATTATAPSARDMSDNSDSVMRTTAPKRRPYGVRRRHAIRTVAKGPAQDVAVISSSDLADPMRPNADAEAREFRPPPRSIAFHNDVSS